MSHMMCLCGEVIPTGIIPNPQGFSIISDMLEDIIIAKLVQESETEKSEAQLNRNIAGILGDRGTPGILRAYECQHCGRVAVFTHGSDVTPVFWFQLEKVQFPDKAKSLADLTDNLQNGELPVGWQRNLYT